MTDRKTSKTHNAHQWGTAVRCTDHGDPLILVQNDGGVEMLRKLIPGGTNNSGGPKVIHVAVAAAHPDERCSAHLKLNLIDKEFKANDPDSKARCYPAMLSIDGNDRIETASMTLVVPPGYGWDLEFDDMQGRDPLLGRIKLWITIVNLD